MPNENVRMRHSEFDFFPTQLHQMGFLEKSCFLKTWFFFKIGKGGKFAVE